MQAVYDNTGSVPEQRVYRNRPSPHMFAPTAETLSEVVYLVDKDPCVREELSSALCPAGARVVAFSAASEYLSFSGTEAAACVIFNIHLSDLHGLELLRRLAATSNRPVIFTADRFDLEFTVSAMKAGAVDFFTRPLDHSLLVPAIHSAFTLDRKRRQREAELRRLKGRLSLLTPREREVLPLVIGGLLNKQAAAVLGISEVTLQIHRSQVMRKMQAESLAELVRIAVRLRIPHWQQGRSTPLHAQSASLQRVAV